MSVSSPVGVILDPAYLIALPFSIRMKPLDPFRLPEREFAAVLAARPEIARFLATRCPEVAVFIESIIRRHHGPFDAEDSAA